MLNKQPFTAFSNGFSSRPVFINCVLTFILALSVWLVYLPSLSGEFLWDDTAIHQNKGLSDLSGLLSIWKDPGAVTHESHYWPMTYTSFWLEHQAFGMNPRVFRLTNVFLYLLNVLLLRWILGRLNVPFAWAGTFIYALHPAHVESVAWIIERKDVLSGLFFLLAFACWLRFEESQIKKYYALTLFLFLCALLSKTSVIVLPLVMFGVIWWKRGRFSARSLLLVSPFILLAVAMTIIDLRFKVAHDLEPYTLTYLQRCFLACRSLVFYLQKTLMPVDLMVYYPLWPVKDYGLLNLFFVLLAGLLVSVAWVAGRKYTRAIPVAIALFILSLAPVLGFIYFNFLRYSYVADRYLFLPTMFLIPLLVSLAALAMRRRVGRRAPVAVVVCICLLLAWQTWRRAGLFHDNERLFADTLRKNPDSWIAHYQMGEITMMNRRINEAINHYQRSLALRPDQYLAFYHLGQAHALQGRKQQAMNCYRAAIRLKPDLVPVYNDLGALLAMNGALDEAIQIFKRALELEPNNPTTHDNLRLAIQEKGALRIKKQNQ